MTQGFANSQYNVNAPTVSSGAGAPVSTPTKIGDVYFDTTSKIQYTAYGTSSSADWIAQVGKGMKFGILNSSGQQPYNNDRHFATQIICPLNCIVNSINFQKHISDAFNIKIAIYSDSSGVPGSVLGQSAETAINGNDYENFTVYLTTPVALTANTRYWLAHHSDATATLRYDHYMGVTDKGVYKSATYASFPTNPWGTGTNNYYAVYFQAY